MTAWTTPDKVVAALGPGAAPPVDDAYLVECCDAANAAAYRKRRAAGYTDDPDAAAAAPSADVGMGTTLWAVALWRERSSTDGFGSFEDLAGFQPTGGSWASIKRLLAIGRAQVDVVPPDPVVAPYLARRRAALLRRRAYL